MTHWTLQISKTAPPVGGYGGGAGGQLVMLLSSLRNSLCNCLYILAKCPDVLYVLLGANLPISPNLCLETV